jgi:lipoyl synthase
MASQMKTCGFSTTFAGILKSFRPRIGHPLPSTRCYASAAVDDSTLHSTSRRPRTRFSDRLNAGPSFVDFVARPEEPLAEQEAFELRTALVGPEGKQKRITRLPEWLKTPIPDGGNFKKIRNDLRGLSLHTGK